MSESRFARRAQSLSTDAALPDGVRKQFVKTQMCAFYLANRCKLTSDCCPYAHDVSELRQAPDLTKTRMCPEGQRCQRRESCQYAHSPGELRSTDFFFKSRLCKFWETQGKCVLGQSCRFAHGQADCAKPLQGSPNRRWSVCASMLPPQMLDHCGSPQCYED